LATTLRSKRDAKSYANTRCYADAHSLADADSDTHWHSDYDAFREPKPNARSGAGA